MQKHNCNYVIVALFCKKYKQLKEFTNRRIKK